MTLMQILALVAVVIFVILMVKHYEYKVLYDIKIDDTKCVVISVRGLIKPVRYKVYQSVDDQSEMIKIFSNMEQAIEYSLTCSKQYKGKFVSQFLLKILNDMEGWIK